MKRICLLILVILTSTIASAKNQTVILSVPGMTCVTCPITVRRALMNVEGVSKTNVRFSVKLAVVTYDDNKTNVKTLINATANAGYPSVIKK